jgi:hypothetical protein
MLLLAACGGDETMTPMITVTHTLLPGEHVRCIEVFWEIGLPFANRLSVLTWTRRRLDCTVVRDDVPRARV